MNTGGPMAVNMLIHWSYSLTHSISVSNFCFIFSYSSDSIECQRLQARWETVGAKLKNRVNVARVNRYIGGSITARRFAISQSPTFILYVKKLYLFVYNSLFLRMV